MTSPDPRDTIMLHEDEAPVASVANEDDQLPAPSTTGCSAPPSPIESYFNTEVRVRLTCDSCKFTRSHVENFLHLSLEIGGDSSTVADGLRKFFSPEVREVKCEKCFCETAHQTMEIERLPRALLLHFKRFIVDISDDYSSISYRKNQSSFSFDDKLEFEQDIGGVLADCVSKDVIVYQQNCDDHQGCYKIRSVVNHIGSSTSCGHYTADALRVYPGQPDRQWTRFNDSFVSKISATDAINNSSNTAYLVMYELS
jgi:ubiquitin C-terminal hydrolase